MPKRSTSDVHDSASDDDAAPPDEAADEDEEGFEVGVSGILHGGFTEERTCLRTGLRDGFGVTVVLGQVPGSLNGSRLDVAMMQLDPTRYPTRSRAKKAVRKGLVLRVEGPTQDHMPAGSSKGVAQVYEAAIHGTLRKVQMDIA